jgi:antirestriction protein ArdC
MNIPDSAGAGQPAALPHWSALLRGAVSAPGLLLEAYSAFHRYSTGNQLLALWQCRRRGLAPGPLNTFPGWQALGRRVRRGERALTLLMPLARKRRTESEGEPDDGAQEFVAAFAYKARWFVLAQTEGAELPPSEVPGFDVGRSLATLNVSRVPFDTLDGNVQGFARRREVAVSPLAALPHKTLFHELAHVVLGHTAEGDTADAEHTPLSLREVEAEAVALILCESLGLEGAAYCRGYIQDWLGRGREGEIPDQSARRIFRAADLILRAGRAAEAPAD